MTTDRFKITTNKLKNWDRYRSHSFKNHEITGVSSVNNPKNNTIIFVTDINDVINTKLAGVASSLILVPAEKLMYLSEGIVSSNDILPCSDPRAEYAILLTQVISLNTPLSMIAASAVIDKGAVIGEGTIVESLAYISAKVKIGKNCLIRAGAKIFDNVEIGDHTIIGPNTVVGHEGFGLVKDAEGNNLHIPQLGGVKIGNHVEIGAITTILAGTIDPTVIEDYAKIDDHVHIAHNCIIGRNSIVVACAEVSGSVVLQEGCWIAPNASIKQKLTIGKNAVVGLGAVVLKSVNDGETIVGNPGKVLTKNG